VISLSKKLGLGAAHLLSLCIVGAGLVSLFWIPHLDISTRSWGIGLHSGFLILASTVPREDDRDTSRIAFLGDRIRSESYDGYLFDPRTGSNTPVRTRRLKMPVAFVAVPLVFIGFAWQVRLFRRVGMKAKPGCCTHCLYDLRGNRSGRCPECGTSTSERVQSSVNSVSTNP